MNEKLYWNWIFEIDLRENGNGKRVKEMNDYNLLVRPRSDREQPVNSESTF